MMTKMKSSKLTGLVLCALCTMGWLAPVHAAEETGAAADTEGTGMQAATGEAVTTHTLAGITIEGRRDTLPGGMLNATGTIGFLGEMDVMETPFTVTNINREVMDNFTSPHYGIADALAVSPSIRVDRGGTNTGISVRGISQSGLAFYVNGVPGLLGMYQTPYYWVDNITVISGPNIGVNGTMGYNEMAVGGSIILNSKVATDEGNAEVKVGYRGGQSFEEGFDYGVRFGEDNKFGIRIVAENYSGETEVDGQNMEQRSIMVNLDRRTERAKTNLLIGYIYGKHEGNQGHISFDSDVTSLPGVPDTSRLYKPNWTFSEYDTWLAALNHEQKLSDKLSFYLNAGMQREDYFGYLDGNPVVINNRGDFTISLIDSPMAFTSKYLGMGFKGRFNIGSVTNEYLIGIDKNWYIRDAGSNPNWSWSGTGNLYQSNSWTYPGGIGYFGNRTQDTQMFGWHILDTLKALDDRLQVTLGVHGHDAKRNVPGEEMQKTDAVSPTFAVSYKITPDFMVYADHTETFGYGTEISMSAGYANGGEMLDPTKTKQNEIGFKMKTGKFYHTLTYFEIEQANTVDVWENGLKYLRQEGEQKNKGVEWGFSGDIGDKWDIIGGLMYLESKDEEGNRINGAARWSGSLGVVYDPNERWSLIGRALYMGTSTINDGALHVPSFIRYDLGAAYKTKISNTPVTIHAMCYNVADEDYWQARAGENSLPLSHPRTFVISAAFQI